MKLTDILRQINEEEEDTQSPGEAPIEYDFTIIPSDMQAALDALNNIKNYGIYSKNLANQAEREEIFGPSRDAQKPGVAQSVWNSYSPKERFLKIEEIKERIERKADLKGNVTYDNVGEKSWKRTLDLLSKDKDYAAWVEKNGENPEDYLVSLDGATVNKKYKLFGDYSKVFFPQKLGDEEAKYKPLQQDSNFIVADNKIVFPLAKSPYQPKKYLRKVISLIMDNAGVDFEEDKKFQLEPKEPSTATVPTKPKKDEVAPLTYTSPDKNKVDKAIKAFKNAIGDVQGAKYEESSSKDKNGVIQYKVTVTGIAADNRKKLFNVKTTLKEEQNFEMRQMLVRAGIIK